MAIKTASVDKAGEKRRTTASGGVPATRRRTKSGNPGYAGYEYQIGVTAWVALDLMLAKHAADAITIEPQSDEDIEVAIRNPEIAMLGIDAQGDHIDLVLQAKTRSGAPWTTPAIADILLGKDNDESRRGRKRSRPLEMLEADAKRRYIFITNEASVESLRPHEGEHLFDFPEVTELPPHARGGRDADKRAALAPRILLLTGLTDETLRSRITALLEQHGHVPKPKHDACVRELREEVRSRIRGRHDGRWMREELLAILVRHGGSIAPTRDMDHYVRPRSYDRIKEQLDNAHAVVIAGPSGTGKTLTADILELELRRGHPPFDVIGEEHGPGHVRHHLIRSDPVLFHLRDPWGGNRLTPGADRWSGELPKLLEYAGPGRKFLVTSRSDVLESAGSELTKELGAFIVPINIEDYGTAGLAGIYDGIASDLTGHAHALSAAYRNAALRALGRPYEIKRFLVALSREDADAPRKVAELIADSQIEAISRVIAAQIKPLGIDGVQSATMIWAILSARGAVGRDVLAKLVRRLRAADPSLRPDVDGLIDFLVAGQNLRQDGPALSFYHPRVEDGLRLAFLERADEAEYLLGKIVDVLVAWDVPDADWGKETALGVLRALDRVGGLKIELSSATREQINGFLETAALSAEKRLDFNRALRDLIKFGTTDHLPSRLARVLIEGSGKTEVPLRWRAPDLNAQERVALRIDPKTNGLVDRFIREVLPFAHLDYHEEVVTLLEDLASDLREAYWDALDSVAGPGGPHDNIGVIVRGALAGENPDYERAIKRFARSEAEADEWMAAFSDDLYKAEEHTVDAVLADHNLEEPGEQYFNARQGLEHLVRLRREREGTKWIAGNEHAQLLANALADVLNHTRLTPSIDELRLLLDVSEGWVRDVAWSAVQAHWDTALSPELHAELIRGNMDNARLRERLIEIAAANAVAGTLVEQLTASAAAAVPERRLELLCDIMATRLDNDPKGDDGVAVRGERARDLAVTYSPEERELADALVDILAGQDVRAAASTLSADARRHAEAMLPKVSTDVAGPLACLAAGAGADISETLKRLFGTGDAQDGAAAIQALLIADAADLRESLTVALSHRRYPVRRQALELLVMRTTGKEERAQVVALAASDPGADVRLAFARLMEEHRWPEAIEALTLLLGDERDFANQLSPGASWSRYSVARAAASALGAYEVLPAQAIDAILRAAKEGSADPFVACAALNALARHDDARISNVLLTALQSAGLDGAPSHRPRAQAAAWAIFDRAVANRLPEMGSTAIAMAGHESPSIAGPLLLAAGVMSGSERESLLDELHRNDIIDRASLVRMAAIVADCVEELELDQREQLLLRLVQGAPLDTLDTTDRAALEAWSRELDCEAGFQRFTAWIAGQVLQLPIARSVENIRAFDLPDRIGVMTMRSMSPFREEVATPDDGT